MSEREEDGGPVWWGPPAGTNGPGRSDERRYAQNASFMTHLGSASCSFTIGSAGLRKCTKKTHQANFKCLQTPGGINTGIPADLDPLGAEYGKRADTRGKNDELSVQSTHEDTDDDEGSGFMRANHEQSTARKIVKVNRKLHPNPNPYGFARANETELRERKILICSRGKAVGERKDVRPVPQEEVELGFSHAPETELADRKNLKIRYKKGKEETLKSVEDTDATIEAETKEVTRWNNERRREWAEGKERQWKSYHYNLEKETEEKVIRRLGNEVERREEQSKAFHGSLTWKVHVRLYGLQRAIEHNGKLGLVLKWLEGKGKFQVQLESGLLLAVAPEHLIQEPTEGAEGREAGWQTKVKLTQKRRLRKLSRMKRAKAYEKKRSSTQETLGTINQETETKHEDFSKSTKDIRPPQTYKNHNNNNGGKTEGVVTRGVMSLEMFISTKREKMNLATLVTKLTSKKETCYGIYTRDTEQRHNKQVRTLARVLTRTSDLKNRTKIKDNNNGGKTDGVVHGGVMSLVREKMNLTTLVTKRTSKKAKCYGIYKRAKVIIKKRNGSEQKDWWIRPASCKMNTKRKILKGATDVYLLKRTIELEID